MPQYLVTIHLPDNYDPSLEDEEMVRDINALNEEMDAAGARVFAGGLEPASMAKSLRKQPNGEVIITDGPYARGQGAHRWLLDTRSRRHGRGACMGTQGRRCLSGAGRGAWDLLPPTE